MEDVNRCVVVLKVKQPFLDWVRQLPDPTAADLTLAEINDDHAALLIPDFDDNKDAFSYIEANYEELFTHELAGWWADEKDWSRNRSLNMFKEWFDVEIHSLVLDMDQETPLGYFDQDV